MADAFKNFPKTISIQFQQIKNSLPIILSTKMLTVSVWKQSEIADWLK